MTSNIPVLEDKKGRSDSTGFRTEQYQLTYTIGKPFDEWPKHLSTILCMIPKIKMRTMVFPLRKLSSHGVRLASFYEVPSRTMLALVRASLQKSGDDSGGPELPPFEGSGKPASIESLPLESKERMLLEQKLRMKLAKKIRLRRKRLVRKRRMRKKGRWPPSKMKKNKNV